MRISQRALLEKGINVNGWVYVCVCASCVHVRLAARETQEKGNCDVPINVIALFCFGSLLRLSNQSILGAS